jgi:hypothetical protein
MHAKVFDSGKASTSSLFEVSILTSASTRAWSFPFLTISELNPFTLSDFGLHARRPTHKVGNYSPPSKGLATWWLARPSRAGVAPAKLHDVARSHLFIRVQLFFAFICVHLRL